MDPSASVYANTWSPLTWVLVLSLMIVFVMTLMVAFIALVHRSIDHSADTPRTPALELATPDQGGSTGASAIRPPHAA
jgi:hypothetical protein